MNTSEQRDGSAESGSASRPPKRPYRAPVLTEFGQVLALTQNASCDGTNDSTTTTSCVPGNRAMDGSDRRLKTELLRVDTHPLGFGLYLFKYKPEFQATWGTGRQFGVMADEVEPVVPHAVALHEDGYQRVDYAALGIRRALH